MAGVGEWRRSAAVVRDAQIKGPGRSCEDFLVDHLLAAPSTVDVRCLDLASEALVAVSRDYARLAEMSTLSKAT